MPAKSLAALFEERAESSGWILSDEALWVGSPCNVSKADYVQRWFLLPLSQGFENPYWLEIKLVQQMSTLSVNTRLCRHCFAGLLGPRLAGHKASTAGGDLPCSQATRFELAWRGASWDVIPNLIVFDRL